MLSRHVICLLQYSTYFYIIWIAVFQAFKRIHLIFVKLSMRFQKLNNLSSMVKNDLLYITKKLLKWSACTCLHDDVIKWKHFTCYWPFVRGIHRSPVNFPHKGQWHGALMLSLICAWMNGWVNNRKFGYFRRHHAHYDVTVMEHSWQITAHIRNTSHTQEACEWRHFHSDIASDVERCIGDFSCQISCTVFLMIHFYCWKSIGKILIVVYTYQLWAPLTPLRTNYHLVSIEYRCKILHVTIVECVLIDNGLIIWKWATVAFCVTLAL